MNTSMELSNDLELQPFQYANNTTITSIILPPSTLYIPRNCFAYTPNLQTVVIPASVISIEYQAFYESGIQEVIFEPHSNLRSILTNAFMNCTKLRKLTLPNSVRVLGKGCFRNSKVISVDVDVGVDVGVNDTHLQQMLKIERCMMKDEMTGISIGNQLEDTVSSRSNNHQNHQYHQGIHESSVQMQKKQEKEVNKCMTHSNIRIIGSFSFYNTTISSFILPKKVQEIQPCSFTRSTLQSFIIHSMKDLPQRISPQRTQLEYIGSEAFSHTYRFSPTFTFHIPSTVSRIGANAFQHSTVSRVVFDDVNNGSYDESGDSRVDREEIDEIDIGEPILELLELRNTNLLSIAANAFAFMKKLHYISLPSSLYRLGRMTFSVPSSVSRKILFHPRCHLLSTPVNCFSFVNSTTHILKIPSSVRLLSKMTFYQAKFHSLILDDASILFLGQESLARLECLDEITLPTSIIMIAKSALEESCVRGIDHCDNIKYILYRALVKTNIPAIFFRNGLSYLGKSAFSDSIKLNSIRICDTYDMRVDSESNARNERNERSEVNGISTNTSSNMDLSISPAFPLTIVPDNCFSNCTELVTVLLPHTVEILGSNSFEACPIECMLFQNLQNPQDPQNQGTTQTIFPFLSLMTTPTIPLGNIDLLKLPTISLKTIGYKALGSIPTPISSDVDVVDITEISGDISCQNDQKYRHLQLLIPNKLQFIHSLAFQSIPISSIHFQPISSLLSIGIAAFKSCGPIQFLEFPNNLVSIGKRAFQDTPIKCIVFDIHSRLESLGEDSFSNSNHIYTTSIIAPYRIILLGKHIFNKCHDIQSIDSTT